jgi:hypothetical protein
MDKLRETGDPLMAAPYKSGIEYFSLDTELDRKFDLLESSLGIIGFGVTIKLLQRIYHSSYYLKWDEEELLLFKKRVNVDINIINDVINEGLKWGLFSREMYDKYSILTSHGIQIRYIAATQRRTVVTFYQEYLLVSQEEFSYPKGVIVNIKSVNDDNNLKKDVIYLQSKVKESKEKENKENGGGGNINVVSGDKEKKDEQPPPPLLDESKKPIEENLQLPEGYNPNPELKKIIEYYSKNVTPMINPVTLESFNEFLLKVPAEVYMLAIRQACRKTKFGKPTLDFIELICNGWIEVGATTPELIIQYEKERKAKRMDIKPRASPTQLVSTVQSSPGRAKCLQEFDEKERLAEELQNGSG